jgi:hypothetical protein
MAMQHSSNPHTPEMAFTGLQSLVTSQPQSTAIFNPSISVPAYPTWTPTAMQVSTPQIKQVAESENNNHSSPLQHQQLLKLQTNFMPPPHMDTRKLTLHVVSPLLTFISVVGWNQKPLQEVDFSNFDADNSHGLGQEFGSMDDETPVIDLRRGLYAREEPPSQPSSVMDSRRPSEMSDSTFSLASSGRLVDPATFDAEVKFTNGIDWSGQTSRKRARISPLESPRLSHPERVRNGSISVTRLNSARSSPYDASQNDRRNRWSTGSVGLNSTPPTTAPQGHGYSSSVYGCSPLNPHNALASVSNDHGITTFAAPGQHLSYTGNRPIPMPDAQLWHNNPWAPRHFHPQFPMLSGQMEETSFDGISEPPNIYESLDGDETPPPESDMNPEDEDMIPRQEDPQSITDLYKPRWVRGKGHDREGWCGRCEGGCWAKLKNSGFWYHRSYTHGISPNTGRPYPPPRSWRLSEGTPSRWEGLCGQCGEWMKVDTTKKGHNSWFRHVVKCHPKNKNNKKHSGGIQKRRRSTLPGRHHLLPHLRYSSPFAEEDEEYAFTEEPEHMAGDDSPFIEDRPLEMSPHHSELDSVADHDISTSATMSSSATPPTIVETANAEESHSLFHTPLSHQHMLATPMSTPQLSTTPQGDCAPTPQISTPAPTHSHHGGSLVNLHGLGLHNLMVPFRVNYGLGVNTEDGNTPVTVTATSAPPNAFDLGSSSVTSSTPSESLYSSPAITTATTGAIDHTSITSSPMDHGAHGMVTSAYQTPAIVHGFSGLSVYGGTPGLTPDMSMASMTNASGMDNGKILPRSTAPPMMQFGSPLDGTSFGGFSGANWA